MEMSHLAKSSVNAESPELLKQGPLLYIEKLLSISHGHLTILAPGPFPTPPHCQPPPNTEVLFRHHPQPGLVPPCPCSELREHAFHTVLFKYFVIGPLGWVSILLV